MNKRSLGALALLAIYFSLIVPGAAYATTYAGSDSSGPEVLVFSKDDYTDEDQEDTDIRNALLPISNNVTVFDGGDGTDTAWTAALVGIDVLVLPEVDNTFFWTAVDTPVLNAAAKTYIKSWASAGKLIIGTGSYSHFQAITDLTGVDFSSTQDRKPSDPSWVLQISNDALPASVPLGNRTSGIDNYTALSDAQKAVMELVYYDSVEDNAAVVNFKVGSGYYIYNAYDWYPDPGDDFSGARAQWNATLRFAASGEFTEEASSPPSFANAAFYEGPTSFTENKTEVPRGSTVTLTGTGMNFVTASRIGSSNLEIVNQTATSLELLVGLSVDLGYATLYLTAVNGTVYKTNAFIVIEAINQVQPSTQRVNAGSFKGHVAIYTLGYEGQRLSAKVGNDWVIVLAIPASTNNLYRHVEFTGAGVDCTVRIYIDRVLMDTINLTTK
jgi:hypothetical protein